MKAFLVLVFIAAVAHADSPKLADARKAIDDVRYDDARRLLVEALAEGGNSPTAVRQIYELSASTAIVLGERDLGEQYYRRWLALDPAAKLKTGESPKLQEVFVAAQAFMAAQPRLDAKITRPTAGEIQVELSADPLSMVAGVQLDASQLRIVFGADRRARVPITTQSRIYVVDDRGNRLVGLEVPLPPNHDRGPDGPVSPPTEQRDAPPPPFMKRWTTWAVPAAALLVAGAIVGLVAINQQQELDERLARSGEHFFDEIDGQHRTIRRNATLAIALGAGALVFAIPATIFYSRAPSTLSLGPLGGGIGMNYKF